MRRSPIATYYVSWNEVRTVIKLLSNYVDGIIYTFHDNSKMFTFFKMLVMLLNALYNNQNTQNMLLRAHNDPLGLIGKIIRLHPN